jgi:anaerobic ribonucleoside-triphosphate reductase activating protein
MSEPDPILSVAQIIPVTQAEGPGNRFALWFQGCPLRCPGCCNPEMLAFSGGEALLLRDVLDQLRAAQAEHAIEGITLLGGEPTAHAAGAARLARAAQTFGLSVMVFTGFTLEALRAGGSANQRVLFLSGRCRADDPRWRLPNTLEIRLRGNELTVNGFPARQAIGLWKRPATGRIGTVA